MTRLDADSFTLDQPTQMAHPNQANLQVLLIALEEIEEQIDSLVIARRGLQKQIESQRSPA